MVVSFRGMGNDELVPHSPTAGTERHAPADYCASAELVYLQNGPLMRRYAIRRFRVPPAVADELVQDVFVRYLLSPGRVRTDLRAYLIGSISNACRNYWRAQSSEHRVFTRRAAHEFSSDRPFDARLVNELVVVATLAKLPPRCREALRRYYLRDEDTSTIAKAMNTTCGNVNYLMHKCRKRAREVYEAISATEVTPGGADSKL